MIDLDPEILSIMDRINHNLAPKARQQLWTCSDGWIVGYTTTRVENGPHDGKFVALAYRPVGKGSRGGSKKAQEWKLVYEREFRKRKDARAKAETLYFKHHTPRGAKSK